jgi:hypothetical protein
MGDVSEAKSADYDGNDRPTPALHDLVRPSLKWLAEIAQLAASDVPDKSSRIPIRD